MLGAAPALAVTLGLLFLAVFLLKRVQGLSTGGGGGMPLRLLKRVPIGPKQGVGLLQVGDRVLVVSIADAGVRMLTELDTSSSQKALETACAPSVPAGVKTVKRIWGLRIAAALLVTASLVGTAGPVLAAPADSLAASAGPSLLDSGNLPQVSLTVREGKEEVRLTGAVGVVAFIGALTLLPMLLLLMTSFTRILIVLQFLRPAIGTQNSPPMQLLVALSLLLSGVVMNPVLQEVNRVAVQPVMRGAITQGEAYKRGLEPFRQFMLANTGEKEIGVFAEMTGIEDQLTSIEEVPTVTLTSAFVTSELRTAFQMGFLIFIPFVVVDLIVASVLMSLGMFMLPPMMVSLPFKLLLFVLADGWSLVVKNLVLSFR
jgi:flagellar biosynthetic protein FliP